MGALLFFFIFSFFLVHNFPSFSIEGIHKEIFVLTNTSVMVASHQIWKTKKGQVSPYTFFSLAEAEMCVLHCESLQLFIPTARGRNFGVEKIAINATISISSLYTLHGLVNLIGYTHNFTQLMTECRVEIPS